MIGIDPLLIHMLIESPAERKWRTSEVSAMRSMSIALADSPMRWQNDDEDGTVVDPREFILGRMVKGKSPHRESLSLSLIR